VAKKQDDFPVVGIGASAGGIEALEGFFKGVPDKPGLAFVVVTHLNPERESVLSQILARYTNLSVLPAKDGTKVHENCVYVLPSDALLSIRDRHLVISKMTPSRSPRKAVDIFLSALAADVGEYAAGVVLSGGDGDGTLGIKAIKERGGLTLAQTPNGYGPRHADMPESAISTGYVDFPVPAEEMGKKLVEYAHSLRLLDGMAATATAGEVEEELKENQREIYAILRTHVGHEFGGYKPKTFLRRVHRRMQVVQVRSVSDYVAHLRQDPGEVNALFRDLLIDVTNFFRDADAFEKLQDLVIPKLFEGRGADETVRVWVPGCATGEEVFSIAIQMREHMDTLKITPRVQIFATDIDERALMIARAARYPEALLDSVTPERRKRFFFPDAGTFVLTKEVRDLCIFSPHSVIRDTPFSRIDLVSCRNLLIYFGPDVQNQVIPTFHYSLRPGGYLFLGTSENVSQFGDMFVPIDKKMRIFRSRDHAGQPLRVPFIPTNVTANSASEFRTHKSGLGTVALRQSAESQVLERFAPPHVVVTSEGDVVHYSAKIGKYLEPAAGAPTRQLVTMARKGLRLDLRTAFREAVETNRTVVRERLSVEADDGRIQMVTLTVEPLRGQNGEETLFLVLFAD